MLQEIADQVWDLVSSTHLEYGGSEKLLRSLKSPEEMLKFTDLGGKTYSGPEGRVWMFDPVNGTKGFLTGGRCSRRLGGFGELSLRRRLRF